MLRSRSILFVAAIATALAAGATALRSPDDAKPAVAELDKPVADFKLKDVTRDLKPNEKEDAALVDTAKYKDKKAVVLFFVSEKCGTTWRYEKRVGKIVKDNAKNDVAFLGVRSSMNDTPESIRKFAEAKNFGMPVLDDPKSEMAKYYKARVTPSFVVIDKKGVMRYFGSFDDSPDESGVTKPYLIDALKSVLDSKDVAVKLTRPFG